MGQSWLKPLANCFGYSTRVQSPTEKRGEYERAVDAEIDASKDSRSELREEENGRPSAECCEYFSRRIQAMIEKTGEYETTVDAEIEASKVHWSELPEEEESCRQRCLEADKAFFRSLQQQYGGVEGRGFFRDKPDFMQLGEKIAEGAQGAIFIMKGMEAFVMKVFKLEGGLSLEALHKQWPPGMLMNIRDVRTYYYSHGSSPIYEGVMLENGRFGFVMRRCWGDLRKMIDQRMIHNGNRASPFNDMSVVLIILEIAQGMMELHRNGIVHRDLKASNVLIQPYKWDIVAGKHLEFNPLKDFKFPKDRKDFRTLVADYECSVGVVGTAFWRAPEILIALKHRCFHPNLCTEKSDVYSFGMTCYEILTGKIPFEGVLPNNYDIVLEGKRPELPSDTLPSIQSMLDRCWLHEPSERPTFEEIVEEVESIFCSNCKHKSVRPTFEEILEEVKSMF